MKTVFNNRQLCHVFASQSQDNGRNSSGSLYFVQNEIFSYGSHYLLGKIFTDCMILINSDNYSPTTGKQKSYLINACDHLDMLFVPYPDPTNFYCHEDNLKYLESKIIDGFERFLHARTVHGNYNIGSHQEAITNYNAYIEAFKLHTNFEEIKYDSQYLRLLMQFNIETKNKMVVNDSLKDERRIKKLEKIRLLTPATIQKWSNFETLTSEEKQSIQSLTLLRIKENTVHTSKGASVPLVAAVHLYEKILASEEISQSKIGHFTVNALNESRTQIIIGCHEIELKEVERVLGKYV